MNIRMWARCFLWSLLSLATMHMTQVQAVVHDKERAIVKLLQEYLGSVNTLEGQFIQTTTNMKDEVIDTSRGTMQVKRPCFFRWQINDPVKQLIVSNGKKIWNYEEEIKQVSIRMLSKYSDQLPPASVLSGNASHISTTYRIEVTKKKDSDLFTLIPKNQNTRIFDKVQIVFRKKHLKNMKFSSLGTRTTIRFLHLKENITIPDKQFIFKIPPKTEILDETGN